MNTQKHTPGPWKLTIGEYDAAIHADATIAMLEDEATDWKANARLIAAAPDLLDAVQAMVDAFGDQDSILIDQCKAALRKTKGEA